MSTSLARELSEYFVKDNVTKIDVRLGPWQIPNSSVVSFTRLDSLEHIKRVSKDQVILEMGVSAFYIDEEQRKIVQGDLAVPYPKCKEKLNQLREVSCPVEKVHEHKTAAWGNMCHIHVKDCNLKDGTLRIIKIAQVLSS